ncbi:Non-specific serine/threonine protein kinase [Blyttiomyces sp. JEL0837]|nr:Non-specific serine/threonine protein kinase [Blyttiomyces sp. JEL0837]
MAKGAKKSSKCALAQFVSIFGLQPKSEFEAKNDLHLKGRKALRAFAEEQNGELEREKGSVQSLEQKNSHLEQVLAAASDQIDVLNHEKDRLKHEKAVLNHEKEELVAARHREKEAHEAFRVTAESSWSSQETLVKTLEGDRSKLPSKIQEYEDILEKKDNDNRFLQDCNEKLSTAKSDLESELSQVQARLTESNETEKLLRDQIEVLNSTIKTRDDEIKEFKTTVERLRSNVETCGASKALTECDLNTARDELRFANDSCSRLQDAMNRQAQNHEQELKEMEAALLKQISEKQASEETLCDDTVKLEEEVRSLKSMLNASENANLQLQQEHDQLRVDFQEQQSTFESRIRDLEDSNEELKADLAELEFKLDRQIQITALRHHQIFRSKTLRRLEVNRLTKDREIAEETQWLQRDEIRYLNFILQQIKAHLASTGNIPQIRPPPGPKYMPVHYRQNLLEYEVGKKIGEGSYGAVYESRLKGDTNGTFTLVMKVFTAAEDVFSTIKNEVAMTAMVQDLPFVVEFVAYGYFSTFEMPALVFGRAAGGDFAHYLDTVKTVTESEAMFYIAIILLALDGLFERNIIHMDLKLANILIDSEGYLSFADFGLAAVNGKQKDIGTLTWECASPERMINNRKVCTPADDIWSAGACLYEMLEGEYPYDRDNFSNNKEYVEYIKDRANLTFSESLSLEAESLIRGLLNFDPDERVKFFARVQQHAFFDGLDWDKLAKREYEAPCIPTGV